MRKIKYTAWEIIRFVGQKVGFTHFHRLLERLVETAYIDRD